MLVALFCFGTLLTGGGPIRALERRFAPVWFVTSTTGSEKNLFDVYFVNPVINFDVDEFAGAPQEALLRMIGDAQESIDIAAFEFDLTPVAEALISARNRGVEVRWITDDEHGLEADREEGYGLFQMMMNSGIKVRDDDSGNLMHNKFIIFDDHSVWTGSTNLTQNGMFRNNNNVIVFESRDVVNIYQREFNELWRGNSGAESRSTVRRQTAMIEDTPVFVIFAPEDEGMDHLLPLVRRAEESVHFMAFAFTHDELGAELVRKAKRGLDISGVFETRNATTEHSELHRLYCNGVDVLKDGNSATMHHKVFIIDKKIVVTGSFNFSNNANNMNDENMVFLNNREIASAYEEEFDRVWAQGWPPDQATVYCPGSTSIADLITIDWLRDVIEWLRAQ